MTSSTSLSNTLTIPSQPAVTLAVPSQPAAVQSRSSSPASRNLDDRILLIEQRSLALARNYSDLAEAVQVGSRRIKLLNGTKVGHQELFAYSLLHNPKSSKDHLKMGITIPLGDCFKYLGQSFTRQGCFLNALLYDPDNADAYYHLGTTLIDGNPVTLIDEAQPPQQKPAWNAKQLYLKTLLLNSRHADALFQLALLVPIGETVDVTDSLGTTRSMSRQQLLAEAIQHNPGKVEAYYPLIGTLPHGGSVMVNGDSMTDKALLQKWSELSPHSAVPLYEMVVRSSPEEMGVPQRQQLLVHAIKLQPDLANAYYRLAMTLPKGGSIKVTIDGAIKTLTVAQLCIEAIRYNPKHAKAFNALGIETREGEVELPDKRELNRIELFIEAIKLDSQLAVAYQNLSLLLREGKSVIIGEVAMTKEQLGRKATELGAKPLPVPKQSDPPPPEGKRRAIAQTVSVSDGEWIKRPRKEEEKKDN